MKCFKYAFNGIFYAIKTQANVRIHIVVSVLVISAGFIFKINPIEWVFICFAIGLVLASELFNTTIESLVDIVSPSYNEKAGRVKDIAAGAVLIAAIISVIIGGIIFLPKIMKII
ncbi:MAG: diacylglycerol kinase family protein [Acidobacteria bacterium]|jgi:diacylglycerol kinase|nr:diacylglycerol kinase family protein [Acidobacteriota bacterium]